MILKGMAKVNLLLFYNFFDVPGLFGHPVEKIYVIMRPLTTNFVLESTVKNRKYLFLSWGTKCTPQLNARTSWL